MPVQATMFFTEQVGNIEYGWSESHYLVNDTVLTTAINKLTSLAALRAALCGAGVTLPYLRVSQPSVFRDSQIAEGIDPQAELLIGPTPQANKISPLATTTGSVQGGSSSSSGLALNSTKLAQGMVVTDYEDLIADQPEVGLMLRLESGTAFINRRSTLIRGLPDGVTFTNAPGVVSSNSVLCRNWLKALDAYITALKGANVWGMRVNSVAGGLTTVMAWTVAGTGPYIVTAIVPFAFTGTVGQTCTVSQVAVQYPDGSVRNYRGSLKIASVTANSGNTEKLVTFYTGARNSVFMNSNVLSGAVVRQGTIQLFSPGYLQYSNIVVRRWATRKAGIPFDLQHSRARKKR